MASETVRFVLDKAAGILEREVGLVFGIHEKIEKVKRELLRLEGFLKDAEGKSYGKEGVKQRVKEMNEIACKCEDVIDRYFVEVDYYNMRTDWRGKAEKQIRKPLQLPGRRSIAIDIEELLKKLDDLTSRKDTYDTQSLQDGRDEEESVNLPLELERRRINSSTDEGNSSVTVGLQSETSELAAMLRGGTQSSLCVVSIVGQGGLGKTTLARKVYREVKGSFAVSAWVYVSRNCNTKEVLRELCKACAEYHDLTSGSSKEQIVNCVNEPGLREMANEFLKEKRYLVVLDDVWTRKAWDGLKGALPNDGTGSRVLMTTRNLDVAQYPDSSTHFCPPLLNPRDGYELFCNTVFRQHPNRSPPNRELEELAEKIVSKCGGLALAIVVAGGLLSSRKRTTARAWGEVLSGLRSDLTEENCEVSEILSLSFDDLPYSLKPCLLYCCAFPEGDYDIPVRRTGAPVDSRRVCKVEERKNARRSCNRLSVRVN